MNSSVVPRQSLLNHKQFDHIIKASEFFLDNSLSSSLSYHSCLPDIAEALHLTNAAELSNNQRISMITCSSYENPL